MITHRTVSTDAIAMHVAQQGPQDGPAVVLVHGFPELWFSWRHQLPALADAGYRAIAPDLRGAGDTNAPPGPEGYDVVTLGEDLLGLLDALELDDAVFVGHDWGAAIVWALAHARPDRVRAVVGMSVPYVPRAPAPPVALMRRHLGEDFYMVWFQEPGVADAALARDVRRTLATTEVWDAAWAARDDDPPLPRHLSEEELGVFVAAYERTGFTGGLNLYRNLDRNWELGAPLEGTQVRPPALFVTGTRDPVARFMPHELMDPLLGDLRGKVLIEGGGHWIQQERPDEVNGALLDFLGSVA
jgi:pimeloyl-ACP methyl ester carboxylesterase